VAAFGELGSDRDCIWASKIRAIKHHRYLIFGRGFDQHFLFIDGFFEIGFWKTDRTGDVPYFVKNGRADIEDQRGIALGELIQSPERHAGDSSRSDGGCVEDIGSLLLFGRWIERWDGLVLRVIARSDIQTRGGEANGMKNFPSVRCCCVWRGLHVKRF
jgi:hypothetical protein